MTTTSSTAQPLYVRHAEAADRGSWSVERDVSWDGIDADTALGQPELLAQIRDAALIESFHPVVSNWWAMLYSEKTRLCIRQMGFRAI